MLRKAKLRNSFHQTLAPLLFLAPNLLIFSVFIILPAILGLRMAFYRWNILDTPVFLGLRNFAELFLDVQFWRTLGNTLRYVLLVVPLVTVAALVLAMFVSHAWKAIGLFRVCYYLPTTLSLIIVGISWRWVLGDELGLLNYLLRLVTLPPQPWLTTAASANFSLVMITVWAGTGFYMVMLIAGLQSIPQEFYDAAAVDGSSRLQTFLRITLPLLRPTLLVAIVLATINSFKAFELIFVLTKGGPGSATKFLVQNIYQTAFERERMGYASSMAIMLMLIIALLTASQFLINRRSSDVE